MTCWKGETLRFDGRIDEGEYADALQFRWNADWTEAMKQEIASPQDLDFEGWIKHDGGSRSIGPCSAARGRWLGPRQKGPGSMRKGRWARRNRRNRPPSRRLLVSRRGSQSCRQDACPAARRATRSVELPLEGSLDPSGLEPEASRRSPRYLLRRHRHSRDALPMSRWTTSNYATASAPQHGCPERLPTFGQEQGVAVPGQPVARQAAQAQPEHARGEVLHACSLRQDQVPRVIRWSA